MNVINVYFEMDNWYCEKVAVFYDQKLYIECLPALEKKCKEMGFEFVTESVEIENN